MTTNDQIIQEFERIWQEVAKEERKYLLYPTFKSFLLSSLEQKDQEKEKALEEQKERIKNALFDGAAKRGFEKSDVENEQGWILSIMENTLEQSFKKATGLEIKEVKEKCPCCDELDVFNNEFCNKCGCKEVFPFKERDK